MVINVDQVGFIKGWQAPDGTRRILNILSQAECSKIPVIFLSLDAKKAFDQIHWGFVFKTLKIFGFHSNISSAINAVYTTPLARGVLYPHRSSLW